MALWRSIEVLALPERAYSSRDRSRGTWTVPPTDWTDRFAALWGFGRGTRDRMERARLDLGWDWTEGKRDPDSRQRTVSRWSVDLLRSIVFALSFCPPSQQWLRLFPWLQEWETSLVEVNILNGTAQIKSKRKNIHNPMRTTKCDSYCYIQ